MLIKCEDNVYEPINLSNDHKPGDKEEKERIELMGGNIRQY